MRLGRGGTSFISGLIIGAGIGVLFRELIQNFRSTTRSLREQSAEEINSNRNEHTRLGGASRSRENSHHRQRPVRGSNKESARPQTQSQSGSGVQSGSSGSGAREIPIQTSSARKNSKKPKRTATSDPSSTDELH